MTSKEFASLIGVSQPTVSRALNNSNLVPEEKKQYIIQKAKEYGFELNSQAQSLKTKRTGTIGILFPKHFLGMNKNLMLAYVYDCIQKELSHYSYDIMVIYYDKETDDFSSFERIIRRRKVDGFLVLRMELSDKEMEVIEKYKVPCVFMMNASAKIRGNLNYLFSDSIYGGYLAGCYLRNFTDYEKMFITVFEESNDAKRRLQGFRQALEEVGQQVAQEDILYCALGIDSAYQLVNENPGKFRGRKVAILAYSDMLAIGIVQALISQGIRIPEQVQIIGMDDIPLTTYLHPQISTIHVQVEEMVPRACTLLLDMIEKKDGVIQEWIKPRLILRETTCNDFA